MAEGAAQNGEDVGPMASARDALKIVIEPPRDWQVIDLREIWRYRELLYYLAWRDVKVRYKQTAIGAAWAILQPFLTMVVFSVIFGQFIQMPSGRAPTRSLPMLLCCLGSFSRAP